MLTLLSNISTPALLIFLFFEEGRREEKRSDPAKSITNQQQCRNIKSEPSLSSRGNSIRGETGFGNTPDIRLRAGLWRGNSCSGLNVQLASTKSITRLNRQHGIPWAIYLKPIVSFNWIAGRIPLCDDRFLSSRTILERPRSTHDVQRESKERSITWPFVHFEKRILISIVYRFDCEVRILTIALLRTSVEINLHHMNKKETNNLGRTSTSSSSFDQSISSFIFQQSARPMISLGSQELLFSPERRLPSLSFNWSNIFDPRPCRRTGPLRHGPTSASGLLQLDELCNSINQGFKLTTI